MKHVLITGSASPLGARVLAALTRRAGVERIILLEDGDVSAMEGATPAEVTSGPGHQAPGHPVTLTKLRGQLSRPRFGLDEQQFTELVRTVDTVFHLAEHSAVDVGLELARERNVQPVTTLIEMLKANPALRLIHLSSTLVSGTKRGLFTEFDLSCGQDFHNAYERSKFEAECLLRESSVSDRTTILRASPAYGASKPANGRSENAWLTTALDVLFGLLQRGKWVLISGDPRMHIDIVPLTYLADSIVALAEHPEAAGRTLHLVAGWQYSWSLAQLLATARSRLHRGRILFFPPVLSFFIRLLNLISGGFLAAFPGRLGALRPYFCHRVTFDDFQARRLLEPLGVRCPAPETCLEQWLISDETAPQALAETRSTS